MRFIRIVFGVFVVFFFVFFSFCCFCFVFCGALDLRSEAEGRAGCVKPTPPARRYVLQQFPNADVGITDFDRGNQERKFRPATRNVRFWRRADSDPSRAGYD